MRLCSCVDVDEERLQLHDTLLVMTSYCTIRILHDIVYESDSVHNTCAQWTEYVCENYIFSGRAHVTWLHTQYDVITDVIINRHQSISWQNHQNDIPRLVNFNRLMIRNVRHRKISKCHHRHRFRACRSAAVYSSKHMPELTGNLNNCFCYVSVPDRFWYAMVCLQGHDSMPELIRN